ncbi:MAG: thiamine-phosphate kinase [Phormidesmis sp.]
MEETIAQIGELALIERLKAFCPVGAVGDDAALLRVQPGYELAVTTDMLIEGVHFSDRTTPPYSVGWRAAAANLSDLAAMGARPIGITVGLGLPAHTLWPWVKALYQGMADCLKAYGGVILGGDLCRCDQRSLSITALGEVIAEQAVRRHTATAGMTVVVTGPHGASRAGLAVLLQEPAVSRVGNQSANTAAQQWIKAHQRPVPRFDAIAALRQLIDQLPNPLSEPVNPYPVIAGMDSSDGLANALLQISSSSGVGMDIGRSLIPLANELSTMVGLETAVEWALYGGEDFELVLCLPPELAQKFVHTGFATAIGITTDTSTVQVLPSLDSDLGVPISHKSFQHF